MGPDDVALDGPSEHTIKSAGPAPVTLVFLVVRPPHDPQPPFARPESRAFCRLRPVFRVGARPSPRRHALVGIGVHERHDGSVATTTIWRRRPRGALGASPRPRCVSFLWARGSRAVLRILRARGSRNTNRRTMLDHRQVVRRTLRRVSHVSACRVCACGVAARPKLHPSARIRCPTSKFQPTR